MTPAVVRAALEGIITAATGIPAESIYWSARPRGWIDPPYVVARLRSYADQGWDAIDFQYDNTRPLGEELEPHAKGLRSVTWEVQLWSSSATDAGDALALATALRDRLSLPAYTAALKAAEIAYAGTAALVELDRLQDDRELSVAQLDVYLNATSDVAGARLGYVETWGIEAEAELDDGSTETFINGSYPT